MFKYELEEYARLATRKRIDGMSKGTLKNLRSYLQRYEKFTADYNYRTLIQFLLSLSVEVSTRATVADLLAGFLLHGGYLSDGEAKRVRRSFRAPHEAWGSSPLDKETIEAMIDVCLGDGKWLTSKRDALAIMILASLGPRVGQLCQLNIADIRIDDKVAQITFRKMKDNRKSLRPGLDIKRMPLAWQLGRFQFDDIYFGYASERAAYGGEALFISERGNRMSVNLCQRTIKKRGSQVGIDISPHDFRRYVGTRLTKKYGIERAGVILGHESLSSTQRYVAPDVIADNMEDML